MSQAGRRSAGGGGGSPILTLTGNTGGPVSPTAGNINVVGDGTTITVTDNPGTSTLTISSLVASGIQEIDGDAGIGATGSVIDFLTSELWGTPFFRASGSTVNLEFGDGRDNIGIGLGALAVLTNANSENTTLGSSSGAALSGAGGVGNTLIGYNSGLEIIDGGNNCALGSGTLGFLLDGSLNIAIGDSAGNALTGTESSNIYLNNFGIAAESNTLRIGDSTGTGSLQLSTAFIAGIYGVTPSVPSPLTVVIDSNGQLGTSSGSGGIVTINGNVGSITGTTVTLTTGAANANGTTLFTGSGTTMTMTYDDNFDNLGIGTHAAFFATANSTSSNVAIGASALSAATISGSDNLAIGVSSGSSVTSGASNTFLGEGSGELVTTGSDNIAISQSSLDQLISGSRNIILGQNAGSNYTSSESDNIIMGHNVPGTTAESNVLHIGAGTGTGAGQLNKAIICGIDGINVGSVAKVVTMSATGNQLGTATLTAGTNITITPTANTITIDSTGGSGFTWTEVTGTSASMAVSNGYISSNAGLVTLTLPAVAVLGSIVRVTGKGAGGWLIAQNAGQTIFFGTSTTTTGATGSLASAQRRDGVELVCVTANNDWNVLSAQGNLTVV